MAEILKQNRRPSFSEKLGNAFAQGGQSFAEQLGKIKPSEPEQKKSLLPSIKSILSTTKQQPSDKDLEKLYYKANEYRDLGLSDDESSFKALSDLSSGKLRTYRTERNFQEEMRQSSQESNEKFNSPLSEEAKKIVGKGVENFEPSKKVINLSYKDLLRLSPDQVSQLSKKEQGAYKTRLGGIVGGADALQKLTFGGSEAALRKFMPELSKEYRDETDVGSGYRTGGELLGSFPGISQAYKLVGGTLGKFGVGKKLFGRMVASGTAFAGYEAIKDSLNKGEINTEDLGKHFLVGAALQPAFEGLQKVLSPIFKFGSTLKARGPSVDSAKPSEALLSYTLQRAEASGVPMDALQKGEASAVAEFKKVWNDVKKLSPSVLNETISRIYGESDLKNIARRSQVLQDQQQYYKRTKYIKEEVAAEEARVAERDKPSDKRPATLAREQMIRNEASKEIPQAVARYTSFSKELGKAKDNLSYMIKLRAPVEALEKVKNVIDRLSYLTEEAHDVVKGLQYQKNTAKPYKSNRELDLESANDIENLEHKVATRTPEEIIRPDKRVEEYEGLKKKRVIPGTEMLRPDTQSRLLNSRIKTYEDKITQLKRKKMVTPLEKRGQLDKAIEVAENLTEQAKNNLKLHERRKALQDLSKTVSRKEKLKGKLPSDKKVQSIVEKAIKNPTPENTEKAHEALFGKEESKRINDQMDETIMKADEILSGKSTDGEKEEEFRKFFKEKMKDGGPKFRSEKPKPGNKEQEKAYMNWAKMIEKIFKKSKKYYNKTNSISRLLNKLYKIAFIGSSYPGYWIYKIVVDRNEAKKFSNLESHQQMNYRVELKKKYGNARAKKIEALAKNL